MTIAFRCWDRSHTRVRRWAGGGVAGGQSPQILLILPNLLPTSTEVIVQRVLRTFFAAVLLFGFALVPITVVGIPRIVAFRFRRIVGRPVGLGRWLDPVTVLRCGRLIRRRRWRSRRSLVRVGRSRQRRKRLLLRVEWLQFGRRRNWRCERLKVSGLGHSPVSVGINRARNGGSGWTTAPTWLRRVRTCGCRRSGRQSGVRRSAVGTDHRSHGTRNPTRIDCGHARVHWGGSNHGGLSRQTLERGVRGPLQLLNSGFASTLDGDRGSRDWIHGRGRPIVSDRRRVIRTAITGAKQRVEESRQSTSDRCWITVRWRITGCRPIGRHRLDTCGAGRITAVRINVASSHEGTASGNRTTVTRRDRRSDGRQPGVNRRVIQRDCSVRRTLQRIRLRWRVTAGRTEWQHRGAWRGRHQRCVTSRVAWIVR